MSNSMLEMVVCGICARELNSREHNINVIPLHELPNSHCLILHTAHTKHDLYDGKLLNPTDIYVSQDVCRMKACRQCYCYGMALASYIIRT